MQANCYDGAIGLDRGFLMAETFAEYVKRLRGEMKQSVLADKAGVSQAYISGIERGINTKVDPVIIRKIAEALGRPASEAVRIVYPSGVPESENKEAVDLSPGVAVRLHIPGVGIEEHVLTEPVLEIMRQVIRLRSTHTSESVENN